MTDQPADQTDPREVIADVWRRMNELAFVTKDRPHGNLGPPSAGTERVYAGNFLATLMAAGYELVPARARTDALDVDPPSVTLHPGQHEFRTVCRLCGEDGMLHVSVITHHERVEITDPRKVGR